MKTNEETVGVVIGKATESTKDICRMLAKQGISTLVVQKEASMSEADNTPKVTNHWSGQPGKDLFFNGWKLLF